MIAIPAVDLRDGCCVQLVGGDFAIERIRREDPLAVAREWESTGFTRLHVVDLDAATGRRSNADVVGCILGGVAMGVQVGGGIRDTETAASLLEQGAERLVVGTRALEDMGWLRELAETFPRRIVVAADVRGRQVLTHGWTQDTGDDLFEVLARLARLELAGILVTAVHKEGRLAGADLDLMREVARVSSAPVIASGGIATVEDLRALDECGIAAAIIGMALYTGALDAGLVAAEFNE